MIYVFKTSVKTKMQAKKLKPHIDNLLSNANWNFDLDDCDKVLRIDSEDNIVLRIKELLNIYQFNCEELK